MSIKIDRISSQMMKEISYILDQKLKNPNVTGLISVTKVKVTPDLKYAKVYVSILNSRNIKETLMGLKKSSGFVRSELAKNINLRNTPDIKYVMDQSIAYAAMISKKIDEVNQNS